MLELLKNILQNLYTSFFVFQNIGEILKLLGRESREREIRFKGTLLV